MKRIIRRIKTILLVLLIFSVGVVCGGYLFAASQPRSFLAVGRCEGTCLQPNELVGLVASVGIQRFPGLIPSVVKETDKTIAIVHPSPNARTHFVVIPKRDIKNIGQLSEADRDFLVDMYGVSRQLIDENGLVNYQLIANGPGYQTATYLHFHLIAH